MRDYGNDAGQGGIAYLMVNVPRLEPQYIVQDVCWGCDASFKSALEQLAKGELPNFSPHSFPVDDGISTDKATLAIRAAIINACKAHKEARFAQLALQISPQLGGG